MRRSPHPTLRPRLTKAGAFFLALGLVVATSGERPLLVIAAIALAIAGTCLTLAHRLEKR